jgi:hypothetical protein
MAYRDVQVLLIYACDIMMIGYTGSSVAVLILLQNMHMCGVVRTGLSGGLVLIHGRMC